MPIESVMPFNHLICVVPFSFCRQSFPASGSFPMCQLFALIHKPIILCSYAIVFFTVWDFTFNTSTTEHHFHLGPTTSFFLGLLVIALCSSPVAYWTPSNLGGSSLDVTSFCLFIMFVAFLQQEHWSGVPFPSSSWPCFVRTLLWLIHLGWPCMAWLIASLSYASPYTTTRLWFMKGEVWVVLFSKVE